MMKPMNEMSLSFLSYSANEGFARATVAAFVAQLDPTVGEISDIKTAVSEAVTNSILHGYNNGEGLIEITCEIKGQEVFVEITDHGVGIPDIEKAMEPLYTTKPEWERSGMGFAFMEACMDELQVYSEVGKGTRVKLSKRIGNSCENSL